ERNRQPRWLTLANKSLSQISSFSPARIHDPDILLKMAVGNAYLKELDQFELQDLISRFLRDRTESQKVHYVHFGTFDNQKEVDASNDVLA
ncbi:hypothetical protein ACTXT7_005232, partial [Hymenolepis weldensis]